MKQVEVEKREINVGLQINTHNVGSVEMNDTTNLICNCSEALFVNYDYHFYIIVF